ncbi:lipoyl(octanoyl) transferase LipB [Sulfuriferula thiophila]|uniref:lipoyl(octanoyl) transferase LipB n=1 Tax=Sulfuriferula thiophila TaxID=1781211 RepID=UPI000F60C941|nr:lipoyl(octanoyl) transferase LipB [Sulfuriferula thiophila]
MPGNILLRHLGQVEYLPTWLAMQEFTARRGPDTADEIWLLEHPPVYTLGQAGKPEHLLQITDIPLVNIDRGGQITYHGPGQIVAYLLIDLKRRGYGVRDLVTRIEQTIINLLAEHHIQAQRLTNAPGVYVDNAKIAALGLRIKHGCSYHGLALNVDMDLSPFSYINPCGYQGMAVTQMRDFGVTTPMAQLAESLSTHLIQQITLTQNS